MVVIILKEILLMSINAIRRSKNFNALIDKKRFLISQKTNKKRMKKLSKFQKLMIILPEIC